MVMPREPMLPATYTRPWAMPLHAPLPALPCTTMLAPAFSQPTSSDAGPNTSTVVPVLPSEPSRWPDDPRTVTCTGSCSDIHKRPPMPC